MTFVRFSAMNLSFRIILNCPLPQLSQMVVAGFSAHTDLSKAQEIRNEVHRVTHNLKECQSLSQTYNQ